MDSLPISVKMDDELIAMFRDYHSAAEYAKWRSYKGTVELFLNSIGLRVAQWRNGEIQPFPK